MRARTAETRSRSCARSLPIVTGTPESVSTLGRCRSPQRRDRRSPYIWAFNARADLVFGGSLFIRRARGEARVVAPIRKPVANWAMSCRCGLLPSSARRRRGASSAVRRRCLTGCHRDAVVLSRTGRRVERSSPGGLRRQEGKCPASTTSCERDEQRAARSTRRSPEA